MIKLLKPGRYAPGCYIIVRENDIGHFDMYNEANTVLVQQDTDFPSVARTFGWNGQTPGLICDHGGTDGTIDCPQCGRRAAYLIGDAIEWLDANAGVVAEDPGYFDGR